MPDALPKRSEARRHADNALDIVVIACAVLGLASLFINPYLALAFWGFPTGAAVAAAKANLFKK